MLKYYLEHCLVMLILILFLVNNGSNFSKGLEYKKNNANKLHNPTTYKRT